MVRYLEDELSKVESKLVNFPELKLLEADKVSLFCKLSLRMPGSMWYYTAILMIGRRSLLL